MYLLAAGDSFVPVAGNSAEMPLVVGNAPDWEVVVELGNNIARRRSKCKLGEALNHSVQV